ncbi:MAG TPA: hypothetical protein VGB50_08580 [Flavobacterium sp.]|jgi:hypothetical protein
MKKLLLFFVFSVSALSCSSDDNHDHHQVSTASISFKIDDHLVEFDSPVTVFGYAPDYDLLCNDTEGNHFAISFHLGSTSHFITGVFIYDPIVESEYYYGGGVWTTNAEINTPGRLKGTFSGQVVDNDDQGEMILFDITEGRIDVTYTVPD